MIPPRVATRALRAIRIAVVAACLAASAPAPGAGRPDLQRGMTFAGWSAGDYDLPSVRSQLETLREGGVDSVAIVARWEQVTRHSTEIAPHAERSPTDAGLRRAIREARALGLRVLLKPQIDLSADPDGWRGQIAFTRDEDWARWFESYRRFLRHHAALAREEGVSILCIGVELDATIHREPDWRRVAADARAEFPGELTYASTWAPAGAIRFWDALDYAGLDVYFALAPGSDPSEDRLRAAWRPRREALRAFAERVGRPVLFTEIGFRSVAHAAREPWEWRRPGRPAPGLQARLYRATLETFRGESWLAGLYIWQWRTFPPSDPATDTDYTPQGKPAWDVLRAFYRER